MQMHIQALREICSEVAIIYNQVPQALLNMVIRFESNEVIIDLIFQGLQHLEDPTLHLPRIYIMTSSSLRRM